MSKAHLISIETPTIQKVTKKITRNVVRVLNQIRTSDQDIISLEYDNQPFSSVGISFIRGLCQDGEMHTFIQYADRWWKKLPKRQFELLNHIAKVQRTQNAQ